MNAADAALGFAMRHISNAMTPPLVPTDPIHHVGLAVVNALRSDPASVVSLSHAKLHSYQFDQVPMCWRRCYEDAQLWSIMRSNRSCPSSSTISDSKVFARPVKAIIDDVVRRIDMVLMLTLAPGRRKLLDDVLDALRPAYLSNISLSDEERFTTRSPSPTKRRRLNHATPQDFGITKASESHLAFPPPSKASVNITRPLKRFDRPSMAVFEKHWHSSATPVILTDALSHWPALQFWQLPDHWLQNTHGGQRLVPVELGKMYTDDGWGQRIMTFKEFMRDHLCQSRSQETGYLAQYDLLSQIPSLRNDIAVPDYCYVDTPPTLRGIATDSAPADEDIFTPQQVERLARQYQQFKHLSHFAGPGQGTIPHSPLPSSPPPSDWLSVEATLSDDGSDSESAPPVDPAINIWLGPAGTISPAHTDPHHNILAQVMGRKYVRLYAPDQTEALYPKTNEKGIDMHNTSSVDISLAVDINNDAMPHVPANSNAESAKDEKQSKRKAQSEIYPLFDGAEFFEAILGPGECLFIPRGWWHYVHSLDVSASVSFWWD